MAPDHYRRAPPRFSNQRPRRQGGAIVRKAPTASIRRGAEKTAKIPCPLPASGPNSTDVQASRTSPASVACTVSRVAALSPLLAVGRPSGSRDRPRRLRTDGVPAGLPRQL